MCTVKEKTVDPLGYTVIITSCGNTLVKPPSPAWVDLKVGDPVQCHCGSSHGH